MKKDVHPKWYPEAKVACTCGNTFSVGSTVPEIRVEICAHCHPFFTGTEKLVDTEHRVEKFEKKRVKAEAVKEAAEAAKKKRKKERGKEKEQPKTLKEMLKRG